MDPTRLQLTDQQIVKHIIALNIPHLWIKDFRLAKGHLANTTQDAVEILEEIKLAETKEKKNYTKQKDQQGQNNIKNKG